MDLKKILYFLTVISIAGSANTLIYPSVFPEVDMIFFGSALFFSVLSIVVWFRSRKK